MDAGLKRELEAKVLAGERLTFDDGVALYASDDLAWLGELARAGRIRLVGHDMDSPAAVEALRVRS